MASCGHGEWITPLWDSDAGSRITRIYERAGAFLFGRWTYEGFAARGGSGRSRHEPHRHGAEHKLSRKEQLVDLNRSTAAVLAARAMVTRC